MARDGYLLDNADPHTGERFICLETLFDPISIAALHAAELPADAQCWEVGAGSGSIARVMCDMTRWSGGTVLATDVDTRWLTVPEEVLVQECDLDGMDYPQDRYALIHARLVVEHLKDPAKAIIRMAAALIPGGWLVVEELDPMLPYHPNPMNADDRLINHVGRVFTALLHEHGAAWSMGRRLHRTLQDIGLVNVSNHGHLLPSGGGSAAAALMQTNVLQCRDGFLSYGLTLAQLDRYLELLDRPETDLLLPVFFSARGQRPEKDPGWPI